MTKTLNFNLFTHFLVLVSEWAGVEKSSLSLGRVGTPIFN